MSVNLTTTRPTHQVSLLSLGIHGSQPPHVVRSYARLTLSTMRCMGQSARCKERATGGGRGREGGQGYECVLILLLVLAVCPLVTHLFRDQEPFLLLVEPPPTLGALTMFLPYRQVINDLLILSPLCTIYLVGLRSFSCYYLMYLIFL